MGWFMTDYKVTKNVEHVVDAFIHERHGADLNSDHPVGCRRRFGAANRGRKQGRADRAGRGDTGGGLENFRRGMREGDFVFIGSVVCKNSMPYRQRQSHTRGCLVEYLKSLSSLCYETANSPWLLCAGFRFRRQPSVTIPRRRAVVAA